MFRRTMPTLRLLEIAQRAREEYAIQAIVAPVKQDPAP
jgi:hypothetical protein